MCCVWVGATMTGARARSRQAAHAVLALFILGYVAFVVPRLADIAGGADSGGYYNLARFFTEGHVGGAVRPLPGLGTDAATTPAVLPLGFTWGTEPGTMVNTYPIGFALHLAAAAALVGWGAAGKLTLAVVAGAALLVFYLLAAKLLPPVWSLALVVVLGCYPPALYQFLQPMSDATCLLWSTAAIYAAVQCREGRGAVGWAVAAGFALGLAVLTRATSILLLPAVLVGLGWRPRSWGALVAGGLVPAVVLATYNHLAFGDVTLTGYGRGIWTLFRGQNVAPTLVHFARWKTVFVGPAVLALWLGSAGRTLRRNGWPERVLWLWALALVGPYSTYVVSDDGWEFLRFILPAMPAVLLGAGLTARRLWLWAIASPPSRAGPARALIGAAVGTALVAALALSTASCRRLHVAEVRRTELRYPESIAWIAEQVPTDAVVVAMQLSSALYFYADYRLLNYSRIGGAELSEHVRAVEAAGVPVYALLFPHEQARVQRAPALRWESLGMRDGISLWRVRSAAD